MYILLHLVTACLSNSLKLAISVQYPLLCLHNSTRTSHHIRDKMQTIYVLIRLTVLHQVHLHNQPVFYPITYPAIVPYFLSLSFPPSTFRVHTHSNKLMIDKQSGNNNRLSFGVAQLNRYGFIFHVSWLQLGGLLFAIGAFITIKFL